MPGVCVLPKWLSARNHAEGESDSPTLLPPLVEKVRGVIYTQSSQETKLRLGLAWLPALHLPSPHTVLPENILHKSLAQEPSS
jgi:hypothetical protein